MSLPSSDQAAAQQPAPQSLSARLELTTTFALHALGGAAVWWLLPHRFPLAHLRFWSNTVVPLSVAVLGLVGALAALCGWRRTTAIAGAALLAFWLGLAVTFAAAFPRSGWLLAAFALVLCVVFALRTRRTLPRAVWRDPAALVCAAVMLAAGGVWALAQRAPDPSTLPLDVAAPAPPLESPEQALRPVAPPLEAWPHSGRVKVSLGGVRLDVEPLLTFISRTPDRGWTVLATARDRIGPPREFRGSRAADGGAMYFYEDDGVSSLRLGAPDERGGVELEAITQLDRPVYSHLNSYAYMTAVGRGPLSLEFSPCPGSRITAEPFGYPIGRPARFAYLDAQGTFRVVEATSGEKGPFRELASGPLSRSDPLAITLVDGDKPAVRVVLDDWAAQASTALSPTAGWGVAANAIEFSRNGESAGSPISIYVTLASTSVGRGFDSVGHAAGTYRNRMRIEPVAER